MIEKLVEVGILFDFYGKLLSERQYNVIELFYVHDLSLSEIGEELNISRQSVFDTIKRAENKLYKYEENLGLASKFKDYYKDIKTIIEVSKNIKKIAETNGNSNTEIVTNAKIIENIGFEILKNSWGV
ncbi:YlxM family DNA-binding protein [Wansuia hejianensis]|uniref:UPF0122 protein H8689_04995 n=1 Tax=Wansuia hejianensis TaxID=2763667 RepID=A0A926F222_9FIRM|nr:sigma factor-like helix-turn-helix DNA-binding protein [Wansuia hejianensis]MBC8590484.1 DNA-binding protein [Wansuia hejianensis]